MTHNFFYIAQVFTPEPYLKDIDFVIKLKEKGWNPVVITCFPNYPKGKIFDGYKNKFFEEEYIQDIRVIRVFTYADHSLSSFKRTLYYFIFAFFSALAIIKYGKKDSFYLLGQSSPFIIFCAWAVKLFKPNSMTMLDIQDVFPENIRVSGFIKSKWILNSLDYVLDNFYYNAFDLFLTVSESFRKIVAKKNIPIEKILTLYNWSMVERDMENVSIEFRFENNGYNIVYAGNIGIHQGLSKLSDSLKRITSNNPNIYFHFFGDGTDYHNLQEAIGVNPNIILHGRVPSVEIGKYMGAADALFIHLIKYPIYESIIPSKLQAYIEVGKPILGGIMGESRNFITENNLGFSFESENGDDLEEATLKIVKLSTEEINQIYDRSVNLYKSKFSRKIGIAKLDKFIRDNYFR